MQVVLLAAALSLAAPAFAAQPSAASRTAAAVRAADQAFARQAHIDGVASAFRDWMDPLEGRVHGGPTPIIGAKTIYAGFGGDAPGIMKLEWTPTGAWGSSGGDMGVTTGDWRRTPVDPTKPVMTGRYVTVWRKSADGQWRGLIDIGETDAKPIANAVGAPTR